MRKAILLVLGSIVCVQVGSSFAKNLFPLTGPLVMVWLRVTCAGVLLLLAVRPKLRGHSRKDWLVLLLYSVTLITMNATFYQAIARIPIGLAVTIEFLGPLGVALVKSRGLRDLIWVGLAGLGVALLGGSPHSLTWSGVGFSLLAAACWAGYILVTPHVGLRWPGSQAVVCASILGAVVLAVPVLSQYAPLLANPRIWLGGLAVGLLSSVIPYAFELNALRHLDQRIFSIMMSLEPAMAALFAFLILSEHLTATDLVAMTCVIAASVGVTWTAGRGRVRKVRGPTD